MSDNQQIEERIVASQAISKSFKGILRVSNVKEPEETPDVYLNPDYYGEFKPSGDAPIWVASGTQETEAPLTGENQRYFYGDKYTTLKLPVTDSMGNCLNFSLGAEESLIGTDPSTGVITSNKVSFYTLNADSLKIGLEEIKNENNKDIVGGKLYIEDYDATPASLIVNAYYHHGISDKDGAYSRSSGNLKTIYKSTLTPKVHDGFLYNQESCVQTEDEKQCVVKLKNIRDYVFDKVSSYIKFNSSEIPPGTILNQFCSLEKWYCSVNGNIDDSNNWQGFRPSVGNPIPGTTSNSSSSYFAVGNIEQNTYIGTAQLSYPSTNYEVEHVELPPDFKRGYVLADGSAYQMHLKPPYIADTTTYLNSKLSIDTFFKLFFTIGYYYSPVPRCMPHIYYAAKDAPVRKDSALEKFSYPTTDRYYYDYSDPEIGNYGYSFYNEKNVSKDTLYGIHLATILAFKKFSMAYSDKNIFNTYIKNDKGFWDIEKAIDWLSKQSIEEEFIFNTVFSDNSINEALGINPEINNLIYKHKDVSSGKTLNVKVGREVSKFSDSIEYYEYIPGKNGEVIFKETYCPIYKMAEIYDLARLFAIKDTAFSAYTFTFNVPKCYTNSDLTVLESATLGSSGTGENIGLFIGSSGSILANKIVIPSRDNNHKEPTVYDNLTDSYTYQNSNCTFNIGYRPHSHALAKGCLYLAESRHVANPKPVVRKLTTINRKSGTNVMNNVNEYQNNIIAADFTWDITPLEKDVIGPTNYANKKAMINYFLQEAGPNQNVKLVNVYNGFNGSMGRELAVFNTDGSINSNMHWYARTSGPIWDPNPCTSDGVLSDKYGKGENIGYFRPQSIKSLPLIKL